MSALSGPKPNFTARPGGGFNQQLGQFQNEHLDEQAMQSMMQQKSLGQQAGQAQAQTPPPQTAETQPREVGSIIEETVQRPVKDLWNSMATLLDFHAALGIPHVTDDPQETARKKEILNGYNRLTDEQKKVAQEMYHQRMEKQKQEQEHEHQKQEQLKAQQSQDLVVPSSPKNGPVGPAGSKKKQATMQLNQNRKTLSGPSSAN